MNDRVRAFFDGRGFLEVETPVAVLSPGLEPHLEAFETLEIGPDREATRLYLHTSPEYAMKRMLARGLGCIYQLARVFRNGERSDTHAPEFTMLEWYRQPGTLDALAQDVEALAAEVAEALDGPWKPIRTERFTVSEVFTRVGLPDPLAHTEDIESFRTALGVRSADGDDWHALFWRAWLEHVEPSFSENTLTMIDGFPASMAALARIDPADASRARRFEVYVGRLELANGFEELADPNEQRERFHRDLSERRAQGRALPPVDEGLLQDLPGIEGSAGIALGLDRLLMKCLNQPRIQDVIAFSPREDRGPEDGRAGPPGNGSKR